MLRRSRAFACAPIELAEAKLTVGDEGGMPRDLASTSLAVADLADLWVEAVGMGRDVAELVQRMGSERRLTRGRLERTASGRNTTAGAAGCEPTGAR